MQISDESPTTLPFITIQQGEDFLWLLVTQKPLSEMRSLSTSANLLARIPNNIRLAHCDKLRVEDIDKILEAHINIAKKQESKGPVDSPL